MTETSGDIRSGELPIQHEGFLSHRRFRYLKLAVFVSVLSIVVYFFADPRMKPSGGSWLCYILGTVSALLIVWLMLLGIRKRAITPGRWSLKSWTSAHVYLGSSLLVLGTLHTGFQFGLNVHTLAYALMVIVIVSGFFGVYYYASVPRRMSDNRAQRSQAQMIEQIRGLDRELSAGAQPLDQRYVREIKRAITKTDISPGLFSSLAAASQRCPTTRALEKLRKALRTAPSESRRSLEAIISILERKSALLLRLRRHQRYKMLLQLWLYVHVPISVALLVALAAHIFVVFFYW